MKMKFRVLIFNLIILLPVFIYGEVNLNDDFKISMESLYKSNPNLKYERKILESKDEMMPQALSEFRPEIRGYFEKGKVHTNSHGFNITGDGIRTESSTGITVVQDIFDGGSSLSNVSVAKNAIISQRYILKSAEQQIFLNAIKIYADYATEKSNFDLKIKNVEVLEGRLNLTKEQFSIGEVTLTDVSIAEARLSLAKSDLIESEKNLESISANFFFVFGMKPINPSINPEDLSITQDIDEMKLVSQKNNPNINDLLFRIKSQEDSIKTLKRKKLPKVRLQADASINEGYFRTDSKREVLSAFAKIDIPLYQSGAASSKIRESKSELFALQYLLKQEKEGVLFNLVSSKSSYDHSQSKISAYNKQIESNKIYLEGLRQEMQLGERTMLDLLDGEQELLQSQLDKIKSQRDLFNSYFEILFYKGKLNAKDLNLDVNYYDEEDNLNKVKYKWLDIIE